MNNNYDDNFEEKDFFIKREDFINSLTTNRENEENIKKRTVKERVLEKYLVLLEIYKDYEDCNYDLDKKDRILEKFKHKFFGFKNILNKISM